MNTTLALYIHIPFCRRKCRYCSFTSEAGREKDIPAYIDTLVAEIERRARGERLGSIYLGGGTPSLLSAAQVERILETVQESCALEDDIEISIEANPGTVDALYLEALRAAGVNRLSLGVQSLDDSELSLLGRIHTSAEARQAFDDTRRAGYDNVNIDLIYGLPGQSLKAWEATLHEALAWQPEHLSLYGLTLEPETPLAQDIEAGTLSSPDPDLAADQYELSEDMLEAAGYRHYEISNWALPGRECRHNLVYWHNGPYLGVGVAAHSSLGGHRLANTSNLDDYLAGADVAPAADEEISPELRRAESIILGLRLGEGVDVQDMHDLLGIDITKEYRAQFEDMAAAGLVERSNGHFRLTRRGRLMSNEVFWRFLPDE